MIRFFLADAGVGGPPPLPSSAAANGAEGDAAAAGGGADAAATARRPPLVTLTRDLFAEYFAIAKWVVRSCAWRSGVGGLLRGLRVWPGQAGVLRPHPADTHAYACPHTHSYTHARMLVQTYSHMRTGTHAPMHTHNTRARAHATRNMHPSTRPPPLALQARRVGRRQGRRAARLPAARVQGRPPGPWPEQPRAAAGPGLGRRVHCAGAHKGGGKGWGGGEGGRVQVRAGEGERGGWVCPYRPYPTRPCAGAAHALPRADRQAMASRGPHTCLFTRDAPHHTSRHTPHICRHIFLHLPYRTIHPAPCRATSQAYQSQQQHRPHGPCGCLWLPCGCVWLPLAAFGCLHH